jgi:hypothetical protein
MLFFSRKGNPDYMAFSIALAGKGGTGRTGWHCIKEIQLISIKVCKV